MALSRCHKKLDASATLDGLDDSKGLHFAVVECPLGAQPNASLKLAAQDLVYNQGGLPQRPAVELRRLRSPNFNTVARERALPAMLLRLIGHVGFSVLPQARNVDHIAFDVFFVVHKLPFHRQESCAAARVEALSCNPP